MTKAFAPSVAASMSSQDAHRLEDSSEYAAANSALSAVLGITLAGCFYGLVYTLPFAPLQRYFLGHPVAVAATVLFWFAVAVLVTKWIGVIAQTKQLDAIQDCDLLPPGGDETPAGRWLEENDAGHVARRWCDAISRLPAETRDGHLVARLRELLTRQSQRGTTKHLADDLRELSARDADAAHDSLGLVRIIVWAIPMLGFLGTVIGITQTLGGLDFSNGTAAVENLKSGLYVAFDTTALGLVLSVVAIFLQFPIERAEQRLLASIDARVGHLLSSSLPSDEASDNQTALIADLCRGVQAAVAESLENQARLWRETIDEAQRHWQTAAEDNNNKIAAALDKTFVPALVEHARCVTEASRAGGENLEKTCHQLGSSLRESTEAAADRFEQQSRQLQEAMAYNYETMSSQQALLSDQCQALCEAQHQAEAVAVLQRTLDSNLQRLTQTNVAIDRSVAAAAGDGMADAMRVLARAVDLFSVRLAENKRQNESNPRRAA